MLSSNVLSQVFIVKCYSKSLLLRNVIIIIIIIIIIKMIILIMIMRMIIKYIKEIEIDIIGNKSLKFFKITNSMMQRH